VPAGAGARLSFAREAGLSQENEMKTLQVRHRTVYRYRTPVRFGDHRLMFRPRDSHDLRLLDSRLAISPEAKTRWMHDVFGNSIAIASIEGESDTLSFESEITLQHFGFTETDFPIDAQARNYPFRYDADEVPDLVSAIQRRFPDPDDVLDGWVARFYDAEPVSTQDLLIEITKTIREEFRYEARERMGTQTPVETLQQGSGTCRDYALLMMEALRTLGLASRFVTGYLYDASADVSPTGVRGAAATHAWVQVYVPGAGWMEFDPTNGIIGGENLIRVGVARDPAQAVPLSGQYQGPDDAFAAMEVEVDVRAV
jgi:transglutaminase-like putative cysteine protease